RILSYAAVSSLSVTLFLLFFLIRRLPPRSTLFPYTTLFRSAHDDASIDHTSTFRTSHLHAPILPSETPNITGLHHPNHATKHVRSEEHTSELQSRFDLVCRLLLEKKKTNKPSKQQ